MKKSIKLLSAIVAVALMGTVKADDIQLGHPGYGGNGCPSGSASVTLSPDNKALSIIFDEFIVEAGGFSGKRIARKSCNIAIPVHVPQGFSVSIVDVDYRGYNSLPRGAMSRFSAEYFFAGRRGPKYRKTFRGSLDDDFTLSNQLGLVANTWSACGQDVNLRVNTSMMVRTNRGRTEALSTVDSADFNAGLVYHLQWRRCR